MRRAIAVAAAALAVHGAGGCGSSPPVADIDAITAQSAGAVWSVEAVGCGWHSRGSAFAIDARHLVTNRHVIANDSSPTLRSRDGETRQGKVIGSSAHPDLAVIEVERDLPVTLNWSETDALRERESIVVMGYPLPKYAFSVSAGEVVEFQGPAGLREAALSNVAITFGNSGGPGLRADRSVAGVVTQMVLRSGSKDRVAILFTPAAVVPKITEFLRSPTKVLSTCGLGPDYVPPVPKSYDIVEAPPTPFAAPAIPAPRSLAPEPIATSVLATLPPRPTETPRPTCPAGRPAATVEQLTATEITTRPGWWSVSVRGQVRNEASYAVWVRQVDVTVGGDPPVTASATIERETVEPGGSTGWIARDMEVYSPEGAPTRDDASVVLTWRWSMGRFSWCPSDS